MIEGQTITRPSAEYNAFYTWFDSVQGQHQENPDKVFTLPDNIKSIFTSWINAFDGLPAQILDTVGGDMIKWDRTALLTELNSRAEDYFDYLSYSRDYFVPASSTNKYKGSVYGDPTSVPTLLYYDWGARRWNITTDYKEDMR